MKKLIDELDIDLRSRVSTGWPDLCTYKVWPGRLCEYHLYGAKPYIDKMKKLVDSDTL